MCFRRRPRLFLALLLGILCIFFFWGLHKGPVDISSASVRRVIFKSDSWNELQPTLDENGFPLGLTPEQAETIIVLKLRLPRLVLGLLVGCALAVAGAGMQGLFRNPLADPSLIGVSAGCALGAALLLLVNGHYSLAFLDYLGNWALPLVSCLSGLLVAYFVYRVSRISGQVRVSDLLLIGIAMNAFAAAIIGFMMVYSHTPELRDFIFWSLGSLTQSSWERVWVLLPFVVLGTGAYYFLARRLNLYLLGEIEALTLGVSIGKLKAYCFFLTALLVGATVALCGMIGFVGLMVPHAVRMLVGPDYRYLIPGSALMGGILMIAADSFARLTWAPIEIPIGVVTALLGAPFFILLIFANRNHVWNE